MRVAIENPITRKTLENFTDVESVKKQIVLDAPFDLCVICYICGKHEDDVAHPSYTFEDYHCFVCGDLLGESDNSESNPNFEHWKN